MQDLRWYIKKLEEFNELLTITEEVSWNLEVSAIAAMNHRLQGPALWFKKIKGYDERYSLFTGLFSGTQERSWKRTAIYLGMDPDCRASEYKEEFKRRFLHPIKPTIVDTGPCKEEIHIGKEVNILEFPVPYLHWGDGGRYLGTISAVIAKDLDSDWVNWGNYRVQVHSKNKLGGSFQVGNTLATFYYQKYEARGIPMPFCIALGGSPWIPAMATLPLPPGINEADYAGAMMQEPVELVKAETNNLYVPAHAEIIVEGEVLPLERWDEGPFGEYDGFMNAPRFPRPVYRIHAITHRKDPIFPFISEGFTINCSQCIGDSHIPPMFEIMAQRIGFPVRAVRNPVEIGWSMLVVATEVDRPGIARHLAQTFYSMGAAEWFDKFSIVDSDCDVTCTDEIVEDLILKVHPGRDIYISDMDAALPMIHAKATAEEKARGYGAKSFFDATTPFHWGKEDRPKRIKFETIYSKDLQEKVIKKWEKLGFKEKVR